jgi:hypothetical protein
MEFDLNIENSPLRAWGCISRWRPYPFINGGDRTFTIAYAKALTCLTRRPVISAAALALAEAARLQRRPMANVKKVAKAAAPRKRKRRTKQSDLWLEFRGPRDDHDWNGLKMPGNVHCGLCGNRGIVDTVGRVRTHGGLAVGVRRYCICPNGRVMLKKAAHGIQLTEGD